MLLTLLAITGFALIVVALTLHVAGNVARARMTRKRAELIRQRLQEEPSGQHVVYRKIPIRLGGT